MLTQDWSLQTVLKVMALTEQRFEDLVKGVYDRFTLEEIDEYCSKLVEYLRVKRKVKKETRDACI